MQMRRNLNLTRLRATLRCYQPKVERKGSGGGLKMATRKAATFVTLIAFSMSVAPGPVFARAILQPEPERALPSTAVDEAIARIFNAYPDGGPGLAARIADLVVADPNTAHAIVAYYRSSQITPIQKLAAEQGLAEALKRLRATNFGGPALVGIAVVIGAAIGVAIWLGNDDDGNDDKKSPN